MEKGPAEKLFYCCLKDTLFYQRRTYDLVFPENNGSFWYLPCKSFLKVFDKISSHDSLLPDGDLAIYVVQLNDETLLDQSGGLILLIDFYVLKQYGTEHPITVKKLPHILINDPFFIPLLMYKK